MELKTKIATRLCNQIETGRLTFHNVISLMGFIDPIFTRKLARSGRQMRRELIRYLTAATDSKNRMCWTSVLFPAELLYPFEIYPLTLEVVGGLYSTVGYVHKFLDLADTRDVPATMCSFHRFLIGASETDFVGQPSLVGATSVMCDGNLKSFSEAAKNKDVPFLFLDVPFELSDDAVFYLKNQIKDSIKLFEDVSGRKQTENMFRQMVINVNESFSLMRRFQELWKKNQSNLFQGHEVANFIFPMHFLLGSDDLIEILKARCRDVENGSGFNKFFRTKTFSKDARRLMWLHIVPQFGTDMWSIIDNGETARVVCDEYSSANFEDYDIQDPFGSVAKRLINHSSNGPIERRIDRILRVAKNHRVDGIIHFSSWGCHQASGNVQILGNAIQDAGYKFLNLNGDPVDPRNTSAEQHRTRLEAFLEN